MRRSLLAAFLIVLASFCYSIFTDWYGEAPVLRNPRDRPGSKSISRGERSVEVAVYTSKLPFPLAQTDVPNKTSFSWNTARQDIEGSSISEVDPNPILASPTISGSRLIIRTRSNLHFIASTFSRRTRDNGLSASHSKRTSCCAGELAASGERRSAESLRQPVLTHCG